jgi:hypothetical protein
MPKDVPDLTAAHRFLSADCFNRCWALIDKADRTLAEDEEMIRLTMASHFHWTHRPDYGPKEASIAHWQASRVYALLGRAQEALRYAGYALEAARAEGVPPFYTGSSHEAMARAEAVAGNAEAMAAHRREAERVARSLDDPEERQMILDDLETIPEVR